MRKKQLELVETINNYFGVDAAYFDVDAFTLAKQIIEAGWTKPVRCKDCKHFIQEEHGCNHFGYYSHTPWVDEVDFCSYGERREGE